MPSNNVQRYRESLMMSKAELARRAGVSTLTIDRVESGRPCRLDTKRKILLALGMGVTDKDRVFDLVLRSPSAQRPDDEPSQPEPQQHSESMPSDSNEFS